MTISPKFLIGKTVYLRTDPETPGMVTGYEVRPTNSANGTSLTYYVSFGGPDGGERLCYEVELTDEKSFSES